MGKEHLALKWGNIKSIKCPREPMAKLWHEYVSIGSCVSVMAQNNTLRQKEIICQLIDECNGQIYNDWSGEDYTNNKEAAKKYVMEYDT